MAENVKAENVQVGDFLPGLGNGYVMEVIAGTDMVVAEDSDRYPHVVPGCTYIMYHDHEGEECHLVLSPNSLVQVKRD